MKGSPPSGAEKGLAGLSTPLLRAMRDLCPKKPGESVTFTVGERSVELTCRSRAAAEAELKRRKGVGR